MGIFYLIYSWLISFPEIAVFLGTFFLGDEMVYFFGFLSGAGVLSLITVIIFSIVGNGGCDIFWIFVSRYSLFKKLRRWILNSKNEAENERLLEKIGGKKMFFSLLLSKFFYGTRLFTIFYIANKEENIKKIIFYNSLSVILWVFVVGFLMGLLGKSAAVSFGTIESLRKIIGYAVLTVLALFLFNKFILYRIKHSSNKKLI